ncbi:hypothetical protein K9N50_10760 [bacterium]|nr:hypothetical protein [bacterium]
MKKQIKTFITVMLLIVFGFTTVYAAKTWKSMNLEDCAVVGNLSTENGTVLTSDVTVKTADYSLLATDKGKVFDNYGATGNIKYTLPTWALGLFYTFTVTTAQSVYIDAPVGSMILRLTDTEADSIYSATPGDSITLIASGVSTWTPREIGTWTDGNTD